MGKKKIKGTVTFSELMGTKSKTNIGKKKLKKAAKYHLGEMRLSKKKFKRQMDEYDIDGSVKKELTKYRREHADELACIVLGGRLKGADKYDEKLQETIESGKLFDRTRKSHLRKLSKKNPGLFAYSHIVDEFDPELIKSVLGGKVKKLMEVMDEKSAIKVAPLVEKSDATKVLRVMLKVSTQNDPSNFDAKRFFAIVRPRKMSKKVWDEIIITTVLGIRGHANNAVRDVVNYIVNLLGDMQKDRIKKILGRYAESINKIASSGEKINFIVSLKDLSDNVKISKVLDNSPKIATALSQM